MSDQTKTIFEESGETQNPVADKPQETVTATTKFELPPEVSEYVGPGKKYASPEDALKSVPHAQSYIDQLKEELAEVRKQEEAARRQAEQAMTLEEAVQKIKTEGQNSEKPSVEFDPNVIESLLERKLTEREKATVSKANIESVKTNLNSFFGSEEKAVETYRKAAEEAGMSIEEMNALAQKSPKAVFKLVGMESKQPTNIGKTSSSVNTEAFQGTSKEEVVRLNPARDNLMDAWKSCGDSN